MCKRPNFKFICRIPQNVEVFKMFSISKNWVLCEWLKQCDNAKGAIQKIPVEFNKG